MNIAILALAFMLLIGITPNTGADEPTNEKLIVFEGTVLKVGVPMPASGQFIFYRLAKYRVDHLCSGSYQKDEIVVDHISLFSAEELKGVSVGDRVCLAVKATTGNEIGSHSYEHGIREESESIGTFYVGGEVVPIRKDSCGCAKDAVFYLNHRSKH